MMPTTPMVGTGAWTGGMGMFAGNVYTPDASESASGAVITATWTVTNGTCSATDNAVMTVYAPVTADAGMDKSTCANTMVTMTPAAPSVGTGLWTGGAGTFVGNNYTPTGGESNSTITGTWTVTNGTCSAMDMAIIVVDTTAPTIATISNQTLALDSLCAATLPDYTGIATANDNCSGFMVTQSPVAGTAIYGAGTTTVTMTVTDAAGKTASTSFGVMRNLYSTMISADGMTTFCMDSTVNLTASSNGSYGYQWYKDAAMISGATSATIIADATGLYNVEVTVTGGCVLTSNAIAVTEVTQPAAPTITSNPADVSGVVTICTGTVATLSGPAASEYLWYKAGIIVNYSAVTPNYMVAGPTGSDVYTLAVVPTGMSCLSAQSSAITVVRTAPLAIITPAGPTTFCANMPTTLNANTGAGYTYSWVGNNTAGQITSSFTPTVSGNYSVAVSNAMGCATRSSKVIINVLALPVANAGVDKSICTNVSATIGTVGNAANTYAWSPNTNLSSAAIAMPVASPTAAGLIAYTLTVTGANGCMNTDMVNVTGAALPTTPTLTATTSPVCQGASVMVTPSAPGASSVAWYKNGTSLYVKLPTYTPAFTMPTVAPDMYTITAKNAAGCVSPVSNSVSVMINAAAVPTISSTPAAIGTWISICNLSGNTGSVALTANVSAGTPTYQWEQFVSGSYTAVGSGNTYTANVATTPASSNNKRFRVVATYSNGCVKTSAIRNVRVLTSGCTPRTIEDTKGNSDLTEIVIESDMLSAYPNPTEGLLNVSVENCESSYGELVLSNALGQVVETRLMTIENGKGAEVLDLSEMAAGIYTLSFRTDNSQKVQKVVKE